MIEIPEAVGLAQQLGETVQGKTIDTVEAAHSAHKFAWYQGDPRDYPSLLSGKIIQTARPVGGMVEIAADGVQLVLSEGAAIRFHTSDETIPQKHQLFLQFNDGSLLTVTVQMYAGIFAFREGEMDNPYYHLAKEKPSPLGEQFTRTHFEDLRSQEGVEKLSVKAFLATEQRIPGLGNGTLQDILYNAKIHPKRKMNSLSATEKTALFASVKETLAEMTEKGGRDTEKDLFDQPGGYLTKCSKNTVGNPCAVCGEPIEKSSYLGGSIYYCPGCQRL